MIYCDCFFFQAEAGIRDRNVTGVQTCALPNLTAPSQESANNIAAYFRSVMMHLDYPNRISTSGNLALPFAPPEFPAGETFEFSIYHLMEVDDGQSLFPMNTKVLGRT